MPVDRDVVVRKITLIGEDLLRLRPLAELSPEEYLSRLESQLAAERLLERMIGRMLDVNYHIALETRGVAPRDFFDSFLKLAELQVLPPEFARRIAQAAGLRNRLAHEYNEIDPGKVHQAARAALADIPLYLEHVQRFLDSLPHR
ncbi:MAG: DUF86 domain-containing protein [Armatimonadota bacterium]|nr:DUF86 domain-containing protein [Armatimonadota bacterium]MDR7427669.1 DUF86 domain-containing protein [Armatimonadota bacterium]MDR7463719.1 DUF86 domain-containing protein [Armatimonadota bacterium]MDR7470188.1 DUF86 domain-containing protein [Armatimonadota bacterium]MDR7473616.1 DUF86 domain-containing protein [Armatimonadota bacterium]